MTWPRAATISWRVGAAAALDRMHATPGAAAVHDISQPHEVWRESVGQRQATSRKDRLFLHGRAVLEVPSSLPYGKTTGGKLDKINQFLKKNN